MPLPAFRDDGWLPEGHHAATWDEIADTLGGEPGSVRAAVLARLLAWCDAVRAKGLSGLVILDGSFVSAKPNPGDFDLLFLFDEASEVIKAQDAEAAALVDGATCKTRFGGDVFAFGATLARAFPQLVPRDTFDFIKVTKVPKGVLEVQIDDRQ